MNFGLIYLCAMAGTLALAGSVTNSDGLTVAFVVSGTTVTFTITMPSSLASNYDYWAVGFKASGSATNMVDANLWIITKTGTFYDVWTTANGMPNTSVRGTAVLSSHTSSGGTYTTVITRNLASSSSKEVNFAEGTSYLLMHAYGTATGGQLTKHTTTGATTFTLSNDYVSPDDSSLAVPVAVGVGTATLLFLALY